MPKSKKPVTLTEGKTQGGMSPKRKDLSNKKKNHNIKLQILNPTHKVIATMFLAIMCGYWMYLTQGKSGIGWFIFGLLVIWP